MPNSQTKKPSVLRPSWARVSRLRVAVLFLAVFGVFHLLGWRDDTSVLSGTFAGPNPYLSALRGMLYAMFYFAAVVVSPILVLAAGLDLVLSRIIRRLSRKPPGPATD